MLVRRADGADLGAAGEVTVEAYLADGFLAPDDAYTAVLRDTTTRARQTEVYVAVLDQRVVGTVTFCPSGSAYTEVAADGEGEFRMLAVAPAARRRGVAERLVGTCVDRARQLGYDALVLSTMDSMGTAHRVYQRLGFCRLPQRDWSPEDDVHLLAFRLPLAVSSAPGQPEPA